MGPSANFEDFMSVVEALGSIVKETIAVDVKAALEVATSISRGASE